MKNIAVKKIKSNKGASLSIALLFFLICAVISSVVLTAGTAAAGRLSKRAELDQQYYLVNSAAELIIEELEGKTVLVDKSKNPVAYLDNLGENNIPTNSLVYKLATGSINSNDTCELNISYDSGKSATAYFNLYLVSPSYLKINVRNKPDIDDPDAYALTLYFSLDDSPVGSSFESVTWLLKDFYKGK